MHGKPVRSLRVEMKGKRKKLGKGSKLEPVIAGKGNDRIWGNEFAHHLPAGSAGRAGGFIKIRNRDSDDVVACPSFTDGAEQRIPLCAAGQTVGHVLNVAAGRD